MMKNNEGGANPRGDAMMQERILSPENNLRQKLNQSNLVYG